MERAPILLAVITHAERMGLIALGGLVVLAVLGIALACQRAGRRGVPMRHLPGLSITQHGGATTIIAGLPCSAAAITVPPAPTGPRPVTLPEGLDSRRITVAPAPLARDARPAPRPAPARDAAGRAPGTDLPGPRLAGQV
jgi:hypothetical protein